MTADLFDDNLHHHEADLAKVEFVPSRTAGLERLRLFAPRTGKYYAGQRNYDFGPRDRGNISALSPWIRHRLICEQDVLQAVLGRFTPTHGEKFIQEVFWRSYFKGYLEQRPSIWRAYQVGRNEAIERLNQKASFASDYLSAVGGSTGIDCFDYWARELTETGYLHNHARMWFASIWIFTLRLPWEMGADFFLRHLLDGDPASNTLSWRWVAGLHTKGKTYLARTDNIAKYTNGRFAPATGLAQHAEALVEADNHAMRAVRPADSFPDDDYLLLITEEDARTEDWLLRPPVGIISLACTSDRSPFEVGQGAADFARGALHHAQMRLSAISEARFASQEPSPVDWGETLAAACEQIGVKTVVTAFAPVGPVATRLNEAQTSLRQAGITLRQIARTYDALVWPHATKGFFAVKKKIPSLLQDLKLLG